MNLKINESPLDRAVRLGLAAVLLGLAATGTIAAPLLYLVLVIGVVALFTGVTGFCAVYALVGVSTAKRGTGIR